MMDKRDKFMWLLVLIALADYVSTVVVLVCHL